VKLTQDLLHVLHDMYPEVDCTQFNQDLARYLDGHRDVNKEGAATYQQGQTTTALEQPTYQQGQTATALELPTYQQGQTATAMEQPTYQHGQTTTALEQPTPVQTTKRTPGDSLSTHNKRRIQDIEDYIQNVKHNASLLSLTMPSEVVDKFTQSALEAGPFSGAPQSNVNTAGSIAPVDAETEVTIGAVVSHVLGSLKKSDFASVARYVEAEYRLKFKTGPRKFLGKTDVYPAVHRQDISNFVGRWWRSNHPPARSLNGKRYSARSYY